MILPYALRLLCLCFASFFALNALVARIVRSSSKFAIRFAEAREPQSAARFLLALRLLPCMLASLFVLGLCVPSYFWLEPLATSERVGLPSVVLGILGAATWCVALARAARAILSSARHNRFCASTGESTRLRGATSPVVVLETQAPLLAMSGLLRPQLLISRNILNALSPDELEAALRHEHAHRSSRDNMKRLLLLLAPDAFPFIRPLSGLESNWSKFTEWAADDQAAAGDSLVALSLASALVRVARLGASPGLPVLSTSLLACDRDLSARVDRLLNPTTQAPAQSQQTRSPFRVAGLLMASFALLLVAPSALSAVHQLLELFLH